MKALENMEKQARKASSKVEFEIEYIPGVTEDEDSYHVKHELLQVSAFGPTKEEAIKNARIQVESLLLSKPEILKTFS